MSGAAGAEMDLKSASAIVGTPMKGGMGLLARRQIYSVKEIDLESTSPIMNTPPNGGMERFLRRNTSATGSPDSVSENQSGRNTPSFSVTSFNCTSNGLSLENEEYYYRADDCDLATPPNSIVQTAYQEEQSERTEVSETPTPVVQPGLLEPSSPVSIPVENLLSPEFSPQPEPIGLNQDCSRSLANVPLQNSRQLVSSTPSRKRPTIRTMSAERIDNFRNERCVAAIFPPLSSTFPGNRTAHDDSLLSTLTVSDESRPRSWSANGPVPRRPARLARQAYLSRAATLPPSGSLQLRPQGSSFSASPVLEED